MPTVVIVDDDPDVCDSLSAVASVLGFTCCVFHSAESLLGSWSNVSCDCLIVDVDLPQMNGIVLLQALRETDQMFPAVIYTGCPEIALASRFSDVPVLEKGDGTANIVSMLRRISAIEPDRL